MGGKLGIETTVHLKVEKEILPLLTVPMGDVVPEALDPCVVDAPGITVRQRGIP